LKSLIINFFYISFNFELTLKLLKAADSNPFLDFNVLYWRKSTSIFFYSSVIAPLSFMIFLKFHQRKKAYLRLWFKLPNILSNAFFFFKFSFVSNNGFRLALVILVN